MKKLTSPFFAFLAFAVINIFFTFNAALFASGKTEEEVKTHNDKWILCVTDFDVSMVPEEKLVVVGVITRKIVERLSVISYHIRVSPEYAFYEEQVWAAQRSAAAKALSNKQTERSQYVYRGDAKWKYKQNIAKADADIEELRLALEEIEDSTPLINKEPVFELTPGNTNLTFPAAPKEKAENKFCTDQKADAFLAGSIVDFHGRYYISIKLYTIYTKSFVYEDSIIFSPDDLEDALDEITGRLILALSGNKPSAITVKASPQDSLVLINRSFAGRGETGVIEHPPGQLVITASAEDYESMTVETGLIPGELAEIKINLIPLQYGNVEISGASSDKVYCGALYMGSPPLTLRLPLNVLDYVEVETSDKKKGTAIFYTPDSIDTTYNLSLKTSVPPAKGRVDKVRRHYYWAWGATWVTGIAAWITTHTYNNSLDAALYIQGTGTLDANFENDVIRMMYVRNGTWIAVGAAAAFSVFQVVRYVRTAGKDSPPIVKTDRN